MIFLQSVADYIRTGRTFVGLFAALRRKPIIDFKRERENRPPRFVEVINAYKSGDRIEDIAERFKCSKNTVHRYARMAGLYRPRESTVRNGILATYQQGRPIAEIAARFGVSQALVSKYAGEAKILRKGKR